MLYRVLQLESIVEETGMSMWFGGNLGLVVIPYIPSMSLDLRTAEKNSIKSTKWQHSIRSIRDHQI